MSRRRLAAVLAGLLVLGVAGMSTASAAQLTVTAGLQPALLTETACAPANVAGAPVLTSGTAGTANAGAYAQVSLTGVPAACAGLPLEVTVHGAGGAVLATGSVTATGSAATIAVGSYTASSAQRVVVRLGGWVFPTVWTPPAPSNPTPPLGPITCYRLDAAGNVLTNAAGQGLQCASTPTVSVGAWGDNVTSTAHMQVQWSLATAEARSLLVFDFSHPAYSAYVGSPAASWMRVTSYNGTSQLRPGYSCTSRPVVELMVQHPNTAWGSQSLSGEILQSSGVLSGAVCTG